MNTFGVMLAFVFVGGLTLGAALAAVTLRNLVQAGLCMALVFAGLAVLFLVLGAEFVAFIQLLVYVGAVAVLIIFVIMLTRPLETTSTGPRFSWKCLPGLGVAAAVFITLMVCIGNSPSLWERKAAPEADVAIETIGQMLVSSHLLPLQITGVLLTAALIGAAVIAMTDD